MLLTQTNWLKMPARELGSFLDSPNGARSVGTTLLKRHKTLPHPKEERIERICTTPAKPKDLVIDTRVPSISNSDSSSPKTLKHASKRIGGLPPTPPTQSRQFSSNQASIVSAPQFDISSLQNSPQILSTPATPPNQRSPPTPDVTPPQHRHLPFRPLTSDRYPSSRTESFKTARENLDSEDDDEVTVRPAVPSARPSETEVPRVNNGRGKEIGLGLGLESDNEGTITPKQQKRSQQEFVVFDGEWGASGGEGGVSEAEREWDDNLMRNVTVRKRSKKLYLFTDGPGIEVLEDDIIPPTSATRLLRGLPLQERIARNRLERDSADRRSTEQFAERIAWPAAVDDPESPSTPETRRLSEMSVRSYNSAVVEAMVVDGPPTRRKTLRHTKKQLGLRDFGSEQSVSSGPHSNSNEGKHLHHMRGRIPEQKEGTSASNGTRSRASSGRARREVLNNGGIPVVVIPDRRSSSKSSRPRSLRSTSSRRTKRSTSLTSAPLSQSSKYNDPGYFDNLSTRKRATSESGGSAHLVRTIDFPPSIPARRSSLSAPTSRNVSRAGSLAPETRDSSRAGSLTAESLRAHNMVESRKQQKPATQSQPSDSHRGLRHTRMNVDHNGDPFFGNRLSTQVTPFSQYSYETAGTAAEVSEAQAVSIFPHQNSSVLVVQHQPSEPSQPSPPTLEPIIASKQAPPTMTLNGTATEGAVTPPQPKDPMDEVDSPLRNPRDPPPPPAIKFIPPTPAGLTPGAHEEERQLSYDPNEQPEKPKRTMSLMRRLSNRGRDTEPGPRPVGFLKRTFSLSNTPRREQTDESTQTSKPDANPPTLYPSVSDKPPDGSKLHPFWRPAHFWDDLEDTDPNFEEGIGEYPLFDNRPAPPKRTLSGRLKRTFAILPIQDDDWERREGRESRYRFSPPTDRRIVRRTASGNMRVVKHRSNSSLRRSQTFTSYHYPTSFSGHNDDQRPHSEGDQDSVPFGYGFKDGNGGKRSRAYSIPGLGLRVEYVGWSGLKRRFIERRRERRRVGLRRNISSPRGIKDGVDDVLRRRKSAI